MSSATAQKLAAAELRKVARDSGPLESSRPPPNRIKRVQHVHRQLVGEALLEPLERPAHLQEPLLPLGTGGAAIEDRRPSCSFGKSSVLEIWVSSSVCMCVRTVTSHA